MNTVEMITIQALSATAFSVCMTTGGVKVAFTATCTEPERNGYRNGFDIDIHSITSRSGDDIGEFVKEMELEEFLEYELQDFCYENIYIDMSAVEEEAEKAHRRNMDELRNSYLY